MKRHELMQLANIVLIAHSGIGGVNSIGGINPPCACPPCLLARAVLESKYG